MVAYMKKTGLSSTDDDASGSGKKDKKLRELPSSVDPMDDDDGKPASSKPKSTDAKSVAKPKSTVAKSDTKPKSAVGKSSTIVDKSSKSKSAVKNKSKSGTSQSSNVAKSSSIASKGDKPKSAASDLSPKSISSKVPGSKLAAGSRLKSSSGKSAKSTTATNKPKTPKSGSFKSNKSPSHRKPKIKVIPATEMALKPVMVDGIDHSDMTFDQKKVQFIQTLLKSNVKKLKEIPASESYKEAKDRYDAYSIEEKKPLENREPKSAKALYECNNKYFPKDVLTVCKVYDAKKFDPKKSLFLKTLRHLGKVRLPKVRIILKDKIL